ncbi:MAG: ABC transporter permease subunit [Aigarchaeota archaeon]|nr:ABC transporter permease subunit [Aigarchaeota archaeon]MDW8092788.1 ABC transporter permease subunit [Nitrososphaerota archaeon]
MKLQPILLASLSLISIYLAALIVLPVINTPLMIFQDDAIAAIVNSALTSTVAALIATPVGSVLAYFTMNGSRRFLTPLIMFPIAIPHTAIGVLLLPLVRGLGAIDTWIAIVLAMLIVSTPLSFATVRGALKSMGPELNEFLRPLGVKEYWVYWFYTRSSLQSHVLGLLLAWLRSFSELGAFLIIAHRPVTAGIYIYESFLMGGLAYTIGASLLLVGIAVIFATLLVLIGERDG